MRHSILVSLFTIALPVAGLTISTDAAACGGTFCDNPGTNQPPMPVDQTGENILFARSGEFVEAHVQIQYAGDPERFAWVVPVPEIPELSVGSQQLFVNMLNGTVPTYSVTNTFTSCNGGSFSSSSSSGCGFGLSSAADDASSSVDGARPDETDTDSEVSELRQSVGAFEVSIITASSAADVTIWLEDNGFLGDPAAEPILGSYIEQGYHFVAVKLRPGVGVDEIHPLVIRYPGTEPCIPLKLTAIAAAQDMGVRAFFLGEKQFVPQGKFRHVTINEAQFDWINVGSNYTNVVAGAVDAEGAFGHGFITEYAGSPNVVDLSNVHSDAWDPSAFEDLEPALVIDTLTEQGLAQCTSQSNCDLYHPLLLSILRTHLPAPDEVNEGSFYGCLSCYPDDLPDMWDGTAFAADYDELIVQPAERARDLVLESRYLTRLFTRISPSEMTEDPMFVEAAVPLPDVVVQRSTTLTNACGVGSATTPDGRVIGMDLSAWPSIDSEMSFAERIDQYDASGELVGSVDNSADIDASVQSWNDALGFDPNADPSGGSSAPAVEESDSSGCSCRAGRSTDGRAMFFIGTLLVAALRRRRR